MLRKVKDRLRRIKWLLRSALGRDLFYSPQITVEVEVIGGSPATGSGAWPVHVASLGPESVVYAVGIGDDISFDLALIERFQLHVHAFDPTPTSLRWLEKQNVPDLFVAYPYGLANYDGQATFHAPANPAHVSYSMSHKDGNLAETVDVEVRRLGSLMEMLGHSHIDVLKMDIEGGEYDVISDVLNSGIEVHQILVEFHHRMSGIEMAQTKQAVTELNAAGYKIAYVSAIGEEYLFLKS